MKHICQIKGCENHLGKGSAKIGYKINDIQRELKACPRHTRMIVETPAGLVRVEEDRSLTFLPQVTYFINHMNKGTK